MSYEPDFKVNVYDFETNQLRYTLNLKIKHVRQRDGRSVNPCGGTTVIFEQNSCSVFTANCRHDEQFSRRKGLLTCVQKLLHSTPFRNLPDNHNGTDIQSFHIVDRHMDVFIGKSQVGMYWLD